MSQAQALVQQPNLAEQRPCVATAQRSQQCTALSVRYRQVWLHDVLHDNVWHSNVRHITTRLNNARRSTYNTSTYGTSSYGTPTYDSTHQCMSPQRAATMYITTSTYGTPRYFPLTCITLLYSTTMLSTYKPRMWQHACVLTTQAQATLVHGRACGI